MIAGRSFAFILALSIGLLVAIPAKVVHAQGGASPYFVLEKFFRNKGPIDFATHYRGRIPKGSRFVFEIELQNKWDRDIINIVVRDVVPDRFGIVEYDATAGFVTVTYGGEREKGGVGPDYVVWEIPFLTPDQKVNLVVTVELLELVNMALIQVKGPHEVVSENRDDPDMGRLVEAEPQYAVFYVNEGAQAEGIDPFTGEKVTTVKTVFLRVFLEEEVFGAVLDQEIGGGVGPVSEWPVTNVFP